MLTLGQHRRPYDFSLSTTLMPHSRSGLDTLWYRDVQEYSAAMYLSPFAEELMKLAYGGVEHAQLANATGDAMGASEAVKKRLVRGSHKVDSSIVTRPENLVSDVRHAFPGSTSSKQVGRHIARQQQMAASDLAKSQTDRSLVGRIKSPVRRARGLRRLGGAQHTLVDIRAHKQKAPEAGIESSARKVIPQNKGYGGNIPAIREHNKSGFKLREGSLHADLDSLTPGTSKADRAAIANSKGFGRSSAKKIRKQMIAQGLSPEEASKRTSKVMSGKAPGRLATAVGDVSGSLSDAKHEAKRLTRTAKKTPGGLIRRARDGRLSRRAREAASVVADKAPGLVRRIRR